MPVPPRLIGIAGPSCAGKGTLTQWLAERLGAEVLPLDAYYRPLDNLTLEERARVNFDEPCSLDNELLEQHLRALVRGDTVQHPVYDFARHTRRPDTVALRPTPFVILEGLFTLYWEQVRNLMAARFFITAPDEVCLARRVERDQRERGRSELSVRQQYESTVQPMRRLFIEPSEQWADLVLDGTLPVELNGERVMEYLRLELGTAGSAAVAAMTATV